MSESWFSISSENNLQKTKIPIADKKNTLCGRNFRNTLHKMFACRRPKQRFDNGSSNDNWCQLYLELKKLKRADLVNILQNELKGML